MIRTRLFLLFLGIIIFASLAGVLFVSGTPAEQRKIALDQKRSSDIQSINTSVISYTQQHGALPKTLKDLNNFGSYSPVPTDSETQQPYNYAPLSQTTYKICGAFSLDAKDDRKGQQTYYYYPSPHSDPLSTHGKGYQCLTYTLPDYVLQNIATDQYKVTFIAPAWNEEICFGQPYTIRWTVTGKGMQNIQLGYFEDLKATIGSSADENKTYQDISYLNPLEDASAKDHTGSYLWTAGKTPGKPDLIMGKKYYFSGRATFTNKQITGYSGDFTLKNCGTTQAEPATSASALLKK